MDPGSRACALGRDDILTLRLDPPIFGAIYLLRGRPRVSPTLSGTALLLIHGA